jgi:hypothetical protein
MRPSLELRIFLKHISPEYRHAARIAYWIGAKDATQSFRGMLEKTFADHEADHPEAGTPHKSGRISKAVKDPFRFHAKQVRRRVSK